MISTKQVDLNSQVTHFELEARMNETAAKRSIGNFLKEARLEADTTQAVAAHETGNSIAKIKQYEMGKVIPNLTTAFMLCDFYDVEWEKLGECIQDSLFPREVKGNQSDTGIVDIPTSQSLPSRITSEIRESFKDFGKRLVQSNLEEFGWKVSSEDTLMRHSNYDLKAEKKGKVIRLKITAKKHKTKTTLCTNWEDSRPSFNRNLESDPADFLVMVRFHEDNGSECFVMSVEEAENKSDWMAENMIALGNKPVFLQAYVGGPRNSRFKFNKREEWADFLDNWGIL